jgi:hypothetical protein
MGLVKSNRAPLFALLASAACSPPVEHGTGADPMVQGDRAQQALRNIVHQPSVRLCDGLISHCHLTARADRDGTFMTYPTPTGLTPADLASAYKLDTSVDPHATIAIVEGNGYAAAESDLARYRSELGLPPCTQANGCLTIVNMDGARSPLPPDPLPNTPDAYGLVEGAVDLQAASAACPKCKLLLILNKTFYPDTYVSQATAVALGATVISNSWSDLFESATHPVTPIEPFLNLPGVAIFVASGDNGNFPAGTGTDYEYPATSAHVHAVGGTSLVRDPSTPRGWVEAAWGSNPIDPAKGGAGTTCSVNIPRPSWQTNPVCNMRATSDVSAVADNDTGVAFYNAQFGGWLMLGGTSIAAPLVAGIYALTGHGAEAPSFEYSHPQAFFDVTLGTNGSCGTALCNAGTGWDGPTGIGTPNGAALTCVPQCAGKVCGDDGCGGSCGSCSSGACNAGGQCATPCAHPVCSEGEKLTSSCDPCAAKVCAQDAHCCGSKWDSSCIQLAGSVCGASCSAASCVHSVCSSGKKLESTCEPCATKICAQDAYCCANTWDSICVGMVSSLCPGACP